jgi:type VI secretion system protein ImpH
MAAAGGRPDPALEDTLFGAGHRFEFFQAVRLLAQLYPHRAPVGRAASPGDEVVRFRSLVSLSFPPAPIHEIGRDETHGQPQMTVSFMGLGGPLGVLPRRYTERLIERVRRRDRVLADFLDLFTHRIVSLFYRAWEKHRVFVGYERALAQQVGYEPFAFFLFDLFGMGTGGLLGRLAVDDRALLYYAGLLAQRRRSASALAGLLSEHFGVAAAVVQFCGQWLTIPERSRTRLGRRGRNQVLGQSAVAGGRCWDQQASFQVRIGPLTLAQYAEFLPSGDAFRALVQLTRFFVGQQFDFAVQLVLAADEVPRCQVGAKGIGAPRLGWSTWLKTAPFTRHADDAVFAGDFVRLGALRE